MTGPAPFTIDVPDAALDDLRARLARTRWPVPVPGEPWALGTDEATLRRLVARWATGYDWRAVERELNALPQVTVDLDGRAVHVVHLRGAGPDPTPIVLTHGWPGSFLELLPLGRLLAQPGDGGPGFDVVIPSLPGFAFSEQRPEATDPWSTPELWHRLMHDVLGYERYVAHGGDLGAGVTARLAARHPEALLGIHLLAVAPPGGSEDPPLDAAERAHLAEVERWAAEEGAYEHQQQTRPVTLAYGLSDSPVGLLAWLVEKLRAWSDARGELGTRFSDDDVLTWVSLYWLTNTIGSSFRPYSDHLAHPSPLGRIAVPTALAVFPADLVHPPEAWARRGFELVRYRTLPRGGHFAAWEEPELLAEDIRGFVAGLARPGT